MTTKKSRIRTIADVERYAALNGITLSDSDRARITQAQTAERRRLQKLNEDTGASFADKWNRNYPRLLEMITSIGETILTFSKTVITALGVPIALILLLVVEHHRVVEGIMIFDASRSFANFGAAAAVILNLVLEIQVHHIEHNAGYTPARARRFSFRLWAQSLAYVFGFSRDWKAQELSPAHRQKRLLRLVTFTILALALVGSMRSVIEATDGAWYVAIVEIFTESNLMLMGTWAGGLLFALMAVVSAQALSRYVAIVAVEITAKQEIKRQALDGNYGDELEYAGAMAGLAIIQQKIQRAESEAETASNVALSTVTTAQDTASQKSPSVENEGVNFTQAAQVIASQNPTYQNGHSNGHHNK